jgi:hypothetical protein
VDVAASKLAGVAATEVGKQALAAGTGVGTPKSGSPRTALQLARYRDRDADWNGEVVSRSHRGGRLAKHSSGDPLYVGAGGQLVMVVSFGVGFEPWVVVDVAVVEEGAAEEDPSELKTLVLSGPGTAALEETRVVSSLAVDVDTSAFAYKLSLTGPPHHSSGAPTTEQCQSCGRGGLETARPDLLQSMVHSFSAGAAWPPSSLPQ